MKVVYEFMHLIRKDANRVFSIEDDLLRDRTFNYTPQVLNVNAQIRR